MTQHTGNRPSAPDRAGLISFILAGIAILAWNGYAMCRRVMHILLGEDVPFLARFADTEITTPLGNADTPLSLQLDAATITVRHMSTLGFWSAILEPVLFFLSLATVIVCLLLLSRRALRGELFSKTSTALVFTAGLTGFIGFICANFFGGLASAEALLSLTGTGFNGFVLFTFNPANLFIVIFTTALITHSFVVGSRIQRETVGLV